MFFRGGTSTFLVVLLLSTKVFSDSVTEDVLLDNDVGMSSNFINDINELWSASN